MIKKNEDGNLICALRKSKGHSQTAFADRLGVSSQAVAIFN